jgi:cytochrome c-type protein NapB
MLMSKQNLIIIAILGISSVTAVAVDTKACVGCHGAHFENVALGNSKIVQTMTKTEIEKALKGYKDGSYGGAMKTVMEGQVSNLSDANITEIATMIASDNNRTTMIETNSTLEVNIGACVGCHGLEFDKTALGLSKVVNEMTKAEIETALNGYKSGSYGGNMKALMAGQASKLSDEEIKAIANKFGQ